MRYEAAHKAQEARHVRQPGMRIESGLVHPLGVNVENQGIAQRFVKMNAHAAGLGSRRLQECLQLVAKLLLFPRDWLEADKSVQRQGSPPTEYSVRVAYKEAGATERSGRHFSGGRTASRLLPSSQGRTVERNGAWREPGSAGRMIVAL